MFETTILHDEDLLPNNASRGVMTDAAVHDPYHLDHDRAGEDWAALDETRVNVYLDMQPLRLNLKFIDHLVKEHDSTDDEKSHFSSPSPSDKAELNDHFTVRQLKVLIDKLSKIEKQLLSKG